MSVQSLGQALLDGGVVDAAALSPRLQRAPDAAALLEALISDGLAAEPALAGRLASTLNVPRYDPRQRYPEPEALAVLDAATARRLGVLPVALRGGGSLLWVATCDPTDEALLGEVARRTGLRIKPCVIGPRELARSLDQLANGGFASSAMPRPAAVSGVTFQAVPLPNGLSVLQVPAQPPAAAGSAGGQPAASSPAAPAPQTTAQAAVGSIVSAVAAAARPPTPPPPAATPRAAPDLARMEEDLAQARQVIKVLAQMLVERGLLDGDELKRRLRAERDRR